MSYSEVFNKDAHLSAEIYRDLFDLLVPKVVDSRCVQCSTCSNCQDYRLHSLHSIIDVLLQFCSHYHQQLTESKILVPNIAHSSNESLEKENGTSNHSLSSPPPLIVKPKSSFSPYLPLKTFNSNYSINMQSNIAAEISETNSEYRRYFDYAPGPSREIYRMKKPLEHTEDCIEGQKFNKNDKQESTNSSSARYMGATCYVENNVGNSSTTSSYTNQNLHDHSPSTSSTTLSFETASVWQIPRINDVQHKRSKSVPLVEYVEYGEGEVESDEESTSTSHSSVNEAKVVSIQRHNKEVEKAKYERTIKLYKFLIDLLEKKDPCMMWIERQEGMFRITVPERLAQLWGEVKFNPSMTYGKLARSFRHYYKTGKLENTTVTGKNGKRKLYYKFSQQILKKHNII